MNEQSIFLTALEIAAPKERESYLDQACADDPTLRKQVEALLAAHERSGEFLDVPALKQMAGDSGDPNIGAETSINASASEGEIDLSFLEPSNAPGSLGRLRHYEVREVIGRGGCGIVLKAFDKKLERIVAIKIMAPELAATSPARKRFLREARATAAIRHENVVSIYAVEEQPLPFLVMEYIDGETLQQRIDRTGPLDVPSVLRIAQQIAAGLAAAHDRGLIHRDIKPGNILLEDGTDHLKITDFGLARSADDASMTQSGVIAGTPLYMSPEQAQAQEIDQRSDLFSLGSVLYVMCSGRPPFRAPSTLAVLKRVVEEQPRSIEGIIPEVPKWLRAIIAILHIKEPEERFASAQEVGTLLAHCQSEFEQHGRVELPEDILAKLPQDETERQEQDANESVAYNANSAARTDRRAWPAAAAVALILLIGLGITEATGVTNVVRGTVIRLFSPEGTLVVEVDDPGVSVTIDGEEMVITGAGAKEIRLIPGQYKLKATKDGEVVRQELVTVTRNGRQVVRVSREAATKEDDGGLGQRWPADAPSLAVAPFDQAQAKTHQQQWADYLGLPVEREIIVGQTQDGRDVKLAMVLIPPGEFLMGSTDEEQAKFLAEPTAAKNQWAIDLIPTEGPQHRVRITKPFYLGKYEVTQTQWQAVMGSNPSMFKNAPSHPVENVSWDDIQSFLAKLNEGASSQKLKFALPTEAQWEYACRAGTTTYWHSGDGEDDLRQFGSFRHANEGGWKGPVGQLQPNGFGLHDMHGNMWEWCSDWFANEYYAKSPADDPTGPSAGSFRVFRGGFWRSHAWECRSACRRYISPEQRRNWLGFRFAAEIEVGRPAVKPVTPTDAQVQAVEAAQPSASDLAEKVRQELRKSNPDFDGAITFLIEGEHVTKWSIVGETLADLSPLLALEHLKQLNYLAFDPERDAPVLSRMTSLEKINDESAASYRLAYPVGKPPRGVSDQWLQAVADLPLKARTAAVVEKLQELNPNFDGKYIAHGSPEDWYLTFDPRAVTDLSPLKALPELRQLVCYVRFPNRTWLSDLSPLSGIPLTRLECDRARITDLSPLKDMPLATLHLASTPVEDLSPLEGVPLTNLNLFGTKITDLGPLAGASLKKLDLQGVPVSDLAPLKDAPLEWLNLGWTRVADLSPLEGRQLHYLNLSATEVSDLSPVAAAPLKELHIGSSAVTDLTPVAIAKLRHLTINNTRIDDLTLLKGMPLESLDCWGTPIADLSSLKGMPLEVLSCFRTSVSDLSPLRESPLRKLYCNDRILTADNLNVLRSLDSLQIVNDRPVAEVLREPGSKSPKS